MSKAFLGEAGRQGVTAPGMFGVFYYRSAKAGDAEERSASSCRCRSTSSAAEFAGGATPIDVCARSIRELMAVGVRHFYVSNLPLVPAPPAC